jgi:hypothetical protein
MSTGSDPVDLPRASGRECIARFQLMGLLAKNNAAFRSGGERRPVRRAGDAAASAPPSPLLSAPRDHAPR